MVHRKALARRGEVCEVLGMAGFPNTTWARPLVEKQRENEGTRRVFHAAVPAGAAVRAAATTKE